MSPLFESVILCPNNAKLVGYGMGVGFAPTWLRQVSPAASHNHFNHWIYHHNIHPSQDTALCRLKTYHRSSMTQNVLQKSAHARPQRPIASTVDHKKHFVSRNYERLSVFWQILMTYWQHRMFKHYLCMFYVTCMLNSYSTNCGYVTNKALHNFTLTCT